VDRHADGRKDMTKLISAYGDYAKTFAISNFTKIFPVGAELTYVDRQTDGRTDMTKLIGALGDYAETCKNVSYLTGQNI